MGFMEGGVCLWGPQTLFVLGTSCIPPDHTEADVCWCLPPMPPGHASQLGAGGDEAVESPFQSHCSTGMGRDGSNTTGCGGAVLTWRVEWSWVWGFEAGPYVAWGQPKSLAWLPSSHAFRVGSGWMGWMVIHSQLAVPLSPSWGDTVRPGAF